MGSTVGGRPADRSGSLRREAVLHGLNAAFEIVEATAELDRLVAKVLPVRTIAFHACFDLLDRGLQLSHVGLQCRHVALQRRNVALQNSNVGLETGHARLEHLVLLLQAVQALVDCVEVTVHVELDIATELTIRLVYPLDEAPLHLLQRGHDRVHCGHG